MNSSTINKAELDKFSKIAEDWWKPNGKFKPLHKFNPVRIKYIKESIIDHFKLKGESLPLKKVDILDIGCGGGLLSEPISRLGAKVTGIDASQKNINVAKAHLIKSKLKIKYFCSSPENFKTKKKFDVVLNMEIVEHVDDLNLFIKSTSYFLKKNGIMIIATINKTFKSYIFAIVGAEYILHWLPIGTHDWQKFVEPKQLINEAKKSSLLFKEIRGVKFNPILNNWNISKDTSVNYIAKFLKS